MATRADPADAQPAERAPEPGLALLRRAGLALQSVPRSRSWLPALLWMGLIWGLSEATFGGSGGPRSMGLLTNLGHAPLFGLLALWLALGLPRVGGWPRLSGRDVALVLALVAAYGMVDELHQGHVPGRDPSLFDLLTDLTGAACTLWVAAYAGRGTGGDRGLALRVSLSLGACLAAASLATWGPLAFPGVEWL